MLVLGVIPARAGSKGVPDKNIKKLNGKPLIYYSIKEALKSKFITDLVVSTDSKEIQNISLEYGAECPFLRPAELATDTALAVPTIQHSVRYMEEMKGLKYDYIIMLQPTSPLRRYNDIDNSMEKLINC